MSPVTASRAAVRHVTKASPVELVLHAVIVISIVISASVLGLHGSLNSGDLLAVYTAAITGTATVAGARAGNRQVRTLDPDETYVPSHPDSTIPGDGSDGA